MNRQTNKTFFLSFLILTLIVLAAENASADQLVINSQEWQDIYAGEMYQHLVGKGEVFYILDEGHGITLINELIISPNDKTILLVESKDRPYTKGYQQKLEEKGFKVEKLSSDRPKDTNLLLVKKILEEKDVDGFIIVDGDLGYSAVSVIPYALLTKSAVLFADKENIDTVYDFLSKNRGKKVLLYSHVDREVKSALQEFNLEVIDAKDRYKDNIEMVKRFQEISPKKMVYMTNGEFLEDGLFTSEFPILFVGTTNVPPQVFDFIKESDFTTGMVIGYDLFSNALKLRKDTGLNIYLKHAQGRKGQTFMLNIFPIPSYKPSIKIEAARYNSATKKLEVIFRNVGDVYTYVQTLKHDLVVDEEVVSTVSDEDVFFLGNNDRNTQAYGVDLNKYLDQTILAKSEVLFGETPSLLTFLLTAENTVSVISEDDNSDIEITGAVYNSRAKRFEISIKNIGTVASFVDPEVQNIIIAGEKVTVGGELQRLTAGEEGTFKILLELIDEDFEDNPSVTVHARYGEREDGLIKSKTTVLKLELKGGSNSMLIIIVVVAVVLLWFIFLIKKKKKEEHHHAH